MTTVRFTPIPDTDHVRLDYPFDRAVNEIVKSMPVRGFDPSTKSWWVHERYGEELANHLAAAGHDVAGTEPEMPAIEEFFSGSADFYDVDAKAHAILDDIPQMYRHRVFRAMGKAMYPDLYRR